MSIDLVHSLSTSLPRDMTMAYPVALRMGIALN